MRPSTLALPAALFAALALGGCSYALRIECEPSDALVSVDGQALQPRFIRLSGRTAAIEVTHPGYVAYRMSYLHPKSHRSDLLRVSLQRERYQLRIDSLPPAALRIDQGSAASLPFAGSLESGRHRLLFTAPGYPDQSIGLDLDRGGHYTFRLQHDPNGSLVPLGILSCGAAPKQVSFTPDGNYAYVTLLGGRGFDVWDLRPRTLSEVELPGYGVKSGFVEGIFPEGGSTFLLSQMTTNSIHEFSLAEESHPVRLRTLSTHGDWPKVMAYDPGSKRLAVSNWVSNSVAILDYASGDPLKLLVGLGTPRGLVFSPDGARLYVASYGEGRLFSFDTRSWERSLLLERPGGAFRHLVLSPDGLRLFVSDMANRRVLEVAAADGRLLREYVTASNPNTIDLDPRGRILAVSCRGPNNPEGYMLRSPASGKVLLFDTTDARLIASIDGGVQPTGLDLSPDGRLLAFTNFQDATVELYDISALTAPKATRPPTTP